MSSVVAIVKSIVGQVIAVSPEGIRRVLIEGDRLLAGEEVLTGPGGAVTLGWPMAVCLTLAVTASGVPMRPTAAPT
ncbi:hypothetical protein GLGCALEP_00181 [Pseudomonas sp. MM221]|nr:hypothetical protein GLGCALEP_00181 [Pseudomonas sp. MM221]